MGELFANRRIGDIPMERVPLNEKYPDRDLLEEQDLLFARQSIVAEGAGKVSIFLGSNEPVTFESHLIRARIDQSKADPQWLFYFFESPLGRNRVKSIVYQTAAAGIRGSDLVRVSVRCPEIEEQRCIAWILNSLDDKIESNRRIAKTLEETAATLFKARFVDFVDHDDLVESEIGPIPRGWSVAPIADIGRVYRDLADGASDLPYIGLDRMPKGSTVLTDWQTVDGPSGQSARFAEGDILFGKLRPYFRKVGIAPIDGRCSTEILVLRPSDVAYHGFLFGHVSSQRFIDHCVAVSRGTRMPRSEWKDAGTFAVAVPPDDIAAGFNGVVESMYGWIRVLVHESRTLAAIRDALLPRLVSGQIRVPETAFAESA